MRAGDAGEGVMPKESVWRGSSPAVSIAKFDVGEPGVCDIRRPQ
jgi:hypothetical protein